MENIMENKPASHVGHQNSTSEKQVFNLFPGSRDAKKETPGDSSTSKEDASVRPVQNSTQCHTVILFGAPIAALIMDGVERLCLAQISNILLKDYSYNEIHNRRVALGVTCVQCTPVQLEMLRRVGAMPASSRRCGMITLREAERLCKSFLVENTPPKLPENFAFDVYHKCAWGCRGSFIPSRYNSSRAKCVKCRYCSLFYSPNKFIFHTHRLPDSKYRHPDAANFNSWRRHIFLVDETPNDALQQAWEDVKAMFNGGNRRRITHGSEKQPQHAGGSSLPGYLEPYGCHANPFQLEKLKVFPPLAGYGLLTCDGNKAFPPLRGIRQEEPKVDPLCPSANSIASLQHHSIQRHVAPFVPDPARHLLRTASLHDNHGINFPPDTLRSFLPPHISLDPFWKGPLSTPGVLPPSLLSTWHALMFSRGQPMCFSPPHETVPGDDKVCFTKRGSGDQDMTIPGRRSSGVWGSAPPLGQDLVVPSSSERSQPSSAFRPLSKLSSDEEHARRTSSRPSSPILSVDSLQDTGSPGVMRGSFHTDIGVREKTRRTDEEEVDVEQTLDEQGCTARLIVNGEPPLLEDDD